MLGLSLLLAYMPHRETVLRDHTTVCEVNRFYRPCEDGDELVFEQLIWWDWVRGPVWDYRVVAWKIQAGLRPRYDYGRKLWVTRWRDGERLREVTADHFRETHTLYDPEVADRANLPAEHRRQLTE